MFHPKRYINAWSRHHRSGGFGIHSPYAYQFVRNVWRQRLPYYAYDGICELILEGDIPLGSTINVTKNPEKEELSFNVQPAKD